MKRRIPIGAPGRPAPGRKGRGKKPEGARKQHGSKAEDGAKPVGGKVGDGTASRRGKADRVAKPGRGGEALSDIEVRGATPPAGQTRFPARHAAFEPDTGPLSLFAITAPGLEEITAGELRSLGIARPVIEPGGVGFTGTLREVYQANLWLRTASRVVIRIASFHASEFHELERRAKRIPWGRYIGVPARARFRVTCRKSRLYHSDAVAERLAKIISGAHGLAGGFAMAGGDDAEGAAEGRGPDDGQLFIVRLVNDEVTISADSSGALLHRRGYRQAIAKAPLRETLGAAMVLGSGWTPGRPLVDPLCGSGTIPIEAAMIARRMAPGIDHVAARSRHFAFMDWPGFDDHEWGERVAGAIGGACASAAPIMGADRDAGAIAAAQANAARAGVAADVHFRHQAISALELPGGAGYVVCNPPYGVRVGDNAPLRNLHAQIGKVIRGRARGWTLAMLVADRTLLRQTGIVFDEIFRTTNGGIPVRFVKAAIE